MYIPVPLEGNQQSIAPVLAATPLHKASNVRSYLAVARATQYGCLEFRVFFSQFFADTEGTAASQTSSEDRGSTLSKSGGRNELGGLLST